MVAWWWLIVVGLLFGTGGLFLGSASRLAGEADDRMEAMMHRRELERREAVDA